MLEEQSFEFNQPAHTLFQAKKRGVSVTLYSSGKLMVQGKEMEEFITYHLEPNVLETFSYGYDKSDQTPHIGVDESGKGDFFGPLCIAAVFAEKPEGLKSIGVKDSKKLQDGAILKIAAKIEQSYPYALVRIGPERYNDLYKKFANLNSLLGWGHATAICELIEKTMCNRVIIDQFAAEHVVETALKKKKKQCELIQRTKGEEDLVVAAASILARAAFVRGIERLGKEVELKLPKGANASVISIGKKLVAKHGRDILKKVGKLHFRTTEEILK
ncbi:MAG: Ribonuclease HIII [Chlamydiales bacterium]|nr:Ribonuclease HIII [Chlamydiales bacterium]MCH9620050.1 Ribonuclease HIII [Chlamydiales bacterium]MCH9623531.1 Ribonuclease HIII [Chlamydiales bacterium]